VNISPTEIAEVLLIEPRVHRDERGFFLESFRASALAEAGVTTTFVQDNHAQSKKNTLRGLHYQTAPGQAKLLRCTRGRIWDVAVDIRPNSATFGRWVGIELDAERYQMLYIPIGFAHGYAALSDIVEVQYKCSNYYEAKTEAGIAYDDPDLAIPWPVDNPIVSPRDQNNPRLAEVFAEFGAAAQPVS
jgi:dTDP-4-dehydrorhamnose 3,5-epimerase